jgi:hypothetical protein
MEVCMWVLRKSTLPLAWSSFRGIIYEESSHHRLPPFIPPPCSTEEE